MRWVALTLLLAAPASAMTLRYAVVVGNNTQADGSMPPLRHAEAEATRLGERLHTHARFSSERLVVLTAPSRVELFRAVETVAAQKREDGAALPNAATLFAFIFTGHGGRGGQLELRDGPVSSADIGRLFKVVDADFSLGVFDACFSGGMDPLDLGLKGGIEPAPNPFATLPSEVLNARGLLWLVSSESGQPSYEDPELGGVFTHYFSKALSVAEREGPGITIDAIWRYARMHTLQHTAAKRRPQSPAMVARVRGTRFPYFSFPGERLAAVRLGPAVSGRLLFSYGADGLTEVVDKAPGTAQTIALYPGRVRLVHLQAGRARLDRELTLGSDPLLLSAGSLSRQTRVGRQTTPLWAKGADASLAGFRETPASSVGGWAGYEFAPPTDSRLTPAHRIGAAVTYDYSQLSLLLGVAYGRADEAHATWRSGLNALVATLSTGGALDIGPTRLTLAGTAALHSLWQRFDDGVTRHGVGAELGAEVRLAWPAHGPVRGVLVVGGGAGLSPRVAETPGHIWGGFGRLGIGVGFGR